MRVEKVKVRKSYVFEASVIETRKDPNIEKRNKEIFVVVCVGLGIGNLPGEQCCMEHYP